MATIPTPVNMSTLSSDPVYRRRWWILLTLCSSLLIIGLDSLILNVALPVIQHELNASASDLQWIVDGYSLVFAALLLTTGSLGDRFGRKRLLILGLVGFGLGSLGAALSTSVAQLIALRVVMGIGAALIMPSTLSIITNTFPASERGRAISIWAGVSALGIPLGPVLGGLLLQHFAWGAVFAINIPVVIAALVAGWFLVPDSCDPQATPPDLLGALFSVVGLVALVYGIIEAPQNGWTGWLSLGSWLVAVVVLGAFVAWELRAPHPMLPLEFFRLRPFDSAILAILTLGFSLVGVLFLLTQYVQYVRDLSPFEAGLRLLPVAAVIIGTQLGTRFVERVGPRFVIGGGLLLVALSDLLVSRLATTSGDGQLIATLALLGVALGATLAPSTTLLLGSVPVTRAGIGSAMNSVGLQLGGVLAVAVLGSLANTTYSNDMAAALVRLHVASSLPATIVTASLNGALAVAQHLGGPAGTQLAIAARLAFTDGMGTALAIATGLTIIVAVIVVFVLPPRSNENQLDPRKAKVEEQQIQSTLGGAIPMSEHQ